MKKIATLAVLIAIAGLVSLNAFAHTHDYAGFGGFNPFAGFGYGFGGYGMNYGGYGMNYAGYGMNYGGFGYGMDFGGFSAFGHGMDFDGHFGYGFGGFGNEFTAHNVVHRSIRKIVPIPATASAVNTSISYDENGEIHVRPFDDEDLFTED